MREDLSELEAARKAVEAERDQWRGTAKEREAEASGLKAKLRKIEEDEGEGAGRIRRFGAGF